MYHVRSAVIVAILLFASQSDSSAIPTIAEEPYLSVRTGFMCSQCHVNRTGGGMRTSYGLIYSQTNLAFKPIRSARFYDGKLSPSVSLGANLRAENVSFFRYENSSTETGEASNSSRIPEANVYLLVDVIPDVLSFYADQTLAPNAANRELFGLIKEQNSNSYLKFGRMLLPYGVRFRDNEAFVRSETGYTYDRHDLGIEFGIETGSYSFVANLTDNQISFVGQRVFSRFRIGGSFSRNIKGVDDYKYGVFTGVNLGRFTLLAEGDMMNIAGVDRFAALGELNFLAARGFNFKSVYEYFDRNRDVPNSRDGQERITIGAEPFVTQFLQVGIFYRINRFIPQNIVQNQDQLLVQLHIFF